MIINPVYSKGGAPSSAIIVYAPEGSTVTAQKQGSSIVLSPTVEGTTYTFTGLELGAYDIIGTKDGATDSESVLLDVVAVYEVDFLGVDGAKQWLYNEGKEYPLVTGGWETGIAARPDWTAKVNAVFNDNNITCFPNNSAITPVYNSQAVTKNAIDLTVYTKMHIKGSLTVAVTSGMDGGGIGFYDNRSDMWLFQTIGGFFKNDGNAIIDNDYDIASISGEYYFTACSVRRGKIVLEELWLE